MTSADRLRMMLMRSKQLADVAEQERRRQAVLDHDRDRKRDAKAGLSANERRSLTQKQNADRREFIARQQSAMGLEQMPGNTVVLIDWHMEDGCMARTVGCE